MCVGRFVSFRLVSCRFGGTNFEEQHRSPGLWEVISLIFCLSFFQQIQLLSFTARNGMAARTLRTPSPTTLSTRPLPLH